MPTDKERIRDLEDRIAEVRSRIPPHSVPPQILEDLEEMEAELERLKRECGSTSEDSAT